MRSLGRACKRVACEEDADFPNSHAAKSPPQKKRRSTSTREMQWQKRLQELREFHQIHGHCRVPQKYPPNPLLELWVSRKRIEFKKRENGKQSSMTAERIAKLNNLGFDWAVRGVVGETWGI